MEKTKKKEAKDEKLKDQKIEEQVIKSLEEAATVEEKFQLLLRKHVESEKTNKKVNQYIKGQEKQLEAVLREKENLQREHNKSVLMRDKLVEVCREQQKLIKSVKNESMQKIREEEERRKESQSKFQTSLNEITQSLSKNNDENLKLRDHNIEMTKKLKFLAEQYQTREQQLEKLNEQVQLESQLHQAKMNKVQVEAAMEKEILTKEKQIALEKLLQTQKLLKELTEREQALKEQLNLYTAKYDDFQSSLQKSNDIFATYKVELEKMSKNTKKLEKESLEWKRKWEKSNATLIELATEKKERDDHALRCSKQVEQLQKILRALQNERTHLYKVLRENNIECPAMPALPPEPEPIKATPISSVADKDKMEMMSRNCAELKETLANLQNQMKFLNLKGAPASTETAVETQSQSKSITTMQDESNKKRKNKKQKNKNSKTNVAVKESSPAASLTSNYDTTDVNVIDIVEIDAIAESTAVTPPIEITSLEISEEVTVANVDKNNETNLVEEIQPLPQIQDEAAAIQASTATIEELMTN